MLHSASAFRRWEDKMHSGNMAHKPEAEALRNGIPNHSYEIRRGRMSDRRRNLCKISFETAAADHAVIASCRTRGI